MRKSKTQLKREVRRQVRRELREMIEDHNSRSMLEANPYIAFVHAADQWAKDMRSGLKKQWHNHIPRRPSMDLRTGFGDTKLRRIFIDSGAEDHWDDQGSFRKARAFYLKWKGKPAKDLFRKSARGESVREADLSRRSLQILNDLKRDPSGKMEVGGFSHGLASELYRAGLVEMSRGDRGQHIITITPAGRAYKESVQESRALTLDLDKDRFENTRVVGRGAGFHIFAGKNASKRSISNAVGEMIKWAFSGTGGYDTVILSPSFDKAGFRFSKGRVIKKTGPTKKL